MRAVLDTNVWVSGLIIPASVAGRVLDGVRAGHIDAVASWALAAEIVDVLRRPKLAPYHITEQDVTDVLVLLGPLLPDVEFAVDVRDPDDRPVVAAAVVVGRADAIVSGDDDLIDDATLQAWLVARGIETLTPRDALARVGRA